MKIALVSNIHFDLRAELKAHAVGHLIDELGLGIESHDSLFPTVLAECEVPSLSCTGSKSARQRALRPNAVLSGQFETL